MEKTMTSWTTETLGALAMSTPRLTTRVLAAPGNGFQGTGVSVAKTVLIDPAYDRVVCSGASAGSKVTQLVTPFIDVAHPRLEGPPV